MTSTRKLPQIIQQFRITADPEIHLANLNFMFDTALVKGEPPQSQREDLLFTRDAIRNLIEGIFNVKGE